MCRIVTPSRSSIHPSCDGEVIYVTEFPISFSTYESGLIIKNNEERAEHIPEFLSMIAILPLLGLATAVVSVTGALY